MNKVLEALTRLGFDWHVALANIVNFFIIFFILKYFFFGSIQKVLADRKSKIEQGLIDAKNASDMLENAEAEKKTIIVSAEDSASKILADVQQKSTQLAQVLKSEAEKEIAISQSDAQKNIQKQYLASEQELEAKIPALAAQIVEKMFVSKMSVDQNNKYIENILIK